MSGRRDLRDSLHREMVESKRPWSSDEIARTVLKIVSNPARADLLVRAILGSDPRFRSQGSAWHAAITPHPRLRDLSFLLAEVPRSVTQAVAPPLFLSCYDPAAARVLDPVQVAPDGTGLDRVAAWLDGRLPVSLTGPATRRALHRLEQVHALPSSSEGLLDLTAILRVLRSDRPEGARGDGTGTGRPTVRGEERAAGTGSVRSTGRDEGHPDEDGDGEGAAARLAACRLALEELLDLRGDSCLEEIEGELSQSLQADPVDFSMFRFGRGVISLLPARPGIYRFLDETGKLLYVGKSRDLGRRVAGYFRPLAPGHARRARLLAAVRDLEWETTPSELEALILEGETIRREHPPFNQQVEVHAAGEKTEAREADLAVVLCEGDPQEVSVFFVLGGKGLGRARLPRIAGGELDSKARSLAAAWLSGPEDPSKGFEPLAEEEGILVLRYLRHHRDRIDRLHADEFPSIDEAAAGLARLAVRERPAWEPWTLRSSAERSGSIDL